MNTLELEKLRKKELLKVILIAVPTIFLFLYGLFMSITAYDRYSNEHDTEMLINTVAFLILGLGGLVGYSIIKNFENIFKKHCINDIVTNFLDDRGNLIWHCHRDHREFFNFEERIKEIFGLKNDKHTLSCDGLKETGLFSYNKDYKEDDVFIGKYKGLEIKIIEATIWDSRIFEGVFVKIKSGKEFKNRTLIGDKRKYFSYRNMDVKGLQKLELPNLSKKFNIYTNDFNEAGQILTSEFCDFLLNFKKPIRISLQGDDITAAIDFGKDVFKLGSLFKNVNDPKQYQKFLQDFSVITDVIDRLTSS